MEVCWRPHYLLMLRDAKKGGGPAFSMAWTEIDDRRSPCVARDGYGCSAENLLHALQIESENEYRTKACKGPSCLGDDRA